MWKLYLEGVHGCWRSPNVGNRRIVVHYRVDARESPVRVDMRTVGPWEAIDGGVGFESTSEAKCWAVLHARMCEEQGTMHPRMPTRGEE